MNSASSSSVTATRESSSIDAAQPPSLPATAMPKIGPKQHPTRRNLRCQWREEAKEKLAANATFQPQVVQPERTASLKLGCRGRKRARRLSKQASPSSKQRLKRAHQETRGGASVWENTKMTRVGGLIEEMKSLFGEPTSNQSSPDMQYDYTILHGQFPPMLTMPPNSHLNIHTLGANTTNTVNVSATSGPSSLTKIYDTLKYSKPLETSTPLRDTLLPSPSNPLEPVTPPSTPPTLTPKVKPLHVFSSSPQDISFTSSLSCLIAESSLVSLSVKLDDVSTIKSRKRKHSRKHSAPMSGNTSKPVPTQKYTPESLAREHAFVSEMIAQRKAREKPPPSIKPSNSPAESSQPRINICLETLSSPAPEMNNIHESLSQPKIDYATSGNTHSLALSSNALLSASGTQPQPSVLQSSVDKDSEGALRKIAEVVSATKRILDDLSSRGISRVDNNTENILRKNVELISRATRVLDKYSPRELSIDKNAEGILRNSAEVVVRAKKLLKNEPPQATTTRFSINKIGNTASLTRTDIGRSKTREGYPDTTAKPSAALPGAKTLESIGNPSTSLPGPKKVSTPARTVAAVSAMSTPSLSIFHSIHPNPVEPYSANEKRAKSDLYKLALSSSSSKQSLPTVGATVTTSPPVHVKGVEPITIIPSGASLLQNAIAESSLVESDNRPVVPTNKLVQKSIAASETLVGLPLSSPVQNVTPRHPSFGSNPLAITCDSSVQRLNTSPLSPPSKATTHGAINIPTPTVEPSHATEPVDVFNYFRKRWTAGDDYIPYTPLPKKVQTLSEGKGEGSAKREGRSSGKEDRPLRTFWR